MPLSILCINQKLTDYLKKKFPEREKTGISEILSLSKGWETELFSFVYSYQDREKKYRENLILRIYPGTDTTNKTRREYNALKVLYKTGYPVPKTYILELNPSFFNYPFIIMERILGSDMGNAFFKASNEKNYKELQKEIIDPMCNLFVKLHSLDWRILRQENDIDLIKNQESLVRDYLSKIKTKLEKEQLQELIPILEWLETNSNDIRVELAIIHGDFHPHNIMITDKGNIFVIDWSSCSIGDYREDLGWTLLLTRAYTSKEIRNMILGSYESFKGSKVPQIEFFEVLSALRRLRDIMTLFKYGANKAAMREEAKQQIIDSLPHLENTISLVKEITRISIPEVENFIQLIIKRR